MTKEHVTDEQLTGLFFVETEDDCREHLQSCQQCSERYGELTAVLDLVNRLPVPEQSPAERAVTFETAWQTSGITQHKRLSGFLWPVLRHGLSFGMGLACGMVLLAFTFTKSTGAEITGNPVPANLSGTPAGTVFTKLENPVIVIHQKEKTTKEKKNEITNQQVIEGTTDNGNIQVVWNL